MARFNFVTNNLPEPIEVNVDLAKNLQITLMMELAKVGALNPEINSSNNAKIIAPATLPDSQKPILKNVAYSIGCKVEYSEDLDWDIEGGAGSKLDSNEKMESLGITEDLAKASYLQAIEHFELGKRILRGLIKEGKMKKVAVGSYIGNNLLGKSKE